MHALHGFIASLGMAVHVPPGLATIILFFVWAILAPFLPGSKKGSVKVGSVQVDMKSDRRAAKNKKVKKAKARKTRRRRRRGR